MRISTQMLTQNALRDLNATLQTLARAQSEAISGRRVQTVSDDPVAAAQIMRLNARLRDVDQFHRNATAATTRLSAEDGVLTATRDLVARARDLALAAATQSPTDPLRQAALAQLQQIRQQLVAFGNTKIGDSFIFGGAQTGVPPFQADGTYVGDGTVNQAEIDDQVTVDTNDAGDQLFGPAFAALDALTNALTTGDGAAVEATAGQLNAAGTGMLTAQTNVGARLSEIRLVGQQLVKRSDDMVGTRDGLQNVDPTEAVTRLLAAQNALERAYSVIGRVLSNNILDLLQ